MRALVVVVVAAALAAACSIGALDGFAGREVPDREVTPAEGGPSMTDGAIVDAPSDTGTTDAAPSESKYHAAVAEDAPIVHFALEETTGAACASRVSTSAVCIYPAEQAMRGQPGVGGTRALRHTAATASLSVTGLPGDFSGPYSYELWVRLDDASERTSIGEFMNPATGAGDGFNLFLWDGARVRTETWMSNAVIAYGVAASAFTPAVWHHLVIAHTPNPHRDLFYVDGALVESNTTNQGSPRPLVTSPWKITGFVGLVDEIAVYDKALTPQRIAAHYAAQ